MDDALESPPGRKPPPAEHQFLKGTSGNKRGRPKGSVDLKKLTRKVARKKHAVKVDGKILRKTLLQLVIEATARQAATGVPSMVALFAQIRAKVSPTQDEQKNGFLVVPADVSEQEFIELKKKRGRPKDDNPLSSIRFQIAMAQYQRYLTWLQKRDRSIGLEGWSAVRGKPWWAGSSPHERAARMATARWLPHIDWKSFLNRVSSSQ